MIYVIAKPEASRWEAPLKRVSTRVFKPMGITAVANRARTEPFDDFSFLTPDLN